MSNVSMDAEFGINVLLTTGYLSETTRQLPEANTLSKSVQSKETLLVLSRVNSVWRTLLPCPDITERKCIYVSTRVTDL